MMPSGRPWSTSSTRPPSPTWPAGAELRPESEELIHAALSAVNRRLHDPARLAGEIKQLQDPSAEVRARALASLQAAHGAGANALIAVLADPQRAAEHAAVRAALVAMRGDAIDPLADIIERAEPDLMIQAIEALAQMRATQATVYLFVPALSEESDVQVRAPARAAIVQLMGRLPEQGPGGPAVDRSGAKLLRRQADDADRRRRPRDAVDVGPGDQAMHAPELRAGRCRAGGCRPSGPCRPVAGPGRPPGADAGPGGRAGAGRLRSRTRQAAGLQGSRRARDRRARSADDRGRAGLLPGRAPSGGGAGGRRNPRQDAASRRTCCRAEASRRRWSARCEAPIGGCGWPPWKRSWPCSRRRPLPVRATCWSRWPTWPRRPAAAGHWSSVPTPRRWRSGSAC